MFQDFWWKTRNTLSFFINCTQRVERENLTELLWDFGSVSQQGSQTGHWLCWENDRGKIHFKRKNFRFSVFGRWQNSIWVSRRTFYFEIHIWVFFSSFHDFEPNVLSFGRFFSEFCFRKCPLRHHSSFQKNVFFGRTTHLFIILNFWAKTFGCLVEFFQQSCQNCIPRVKLNNSSEKLFEKQSFSSYFLDSDQKTCKYYQYLFTSFNKTESTCP